MLQRLAILEHDERRDIYELAKILGHSNIKMTERYAKLARHHIARTGNTARGMWTLLGDADGASDESILSNVSLLCLWARLGKDDC